MYKYTMQRWFYKGGTSVMGLRATESKPIKENQFWNGDANNCDNSTWMSRSHLQDSVINLFLEEYQIYKKNVMDISIYFHTNVDLF